MLDVGCDLVVDPDTYTRSTFSRREEFCNKKSAFVDVL